MIRAKVTVSVEIADRDGAPVGMPRYLGYTTIAAGDTWRQMVATLPRAMNFAHLKLQDMISRKFDTE